MEFDTEQKRRINGGLALGYGSKYQLLRMLGWHRNVFNQKIREALNLDTEDIKWIDFRPNDGERLNFDFIQDVNVDWKKYWPCVGSGGIYWDAIGQVDGCYLLVEAKAHIGELENDCGASEPNRTIIKNNIQQLFDDKNISIDASHLLMGDYQLVNRLVALNYLLSHGIEAKLVYVLFINGYEDNAPENKSATLEQWQAAIKDEFKRIKIEGTELEKQVNVVYIDCKDRHYF